MIDNLTQKSYEQGNWKIFINPRPYDFNVEIWLVNKQGIKTFNTNIEEGRLKLLEVKEGVEDSEQKPFLIVPRDVWQILSNAISESTPPIKKEIIESELKATKYHLEDMRKLVFKGI